MARTKKNGANVSLLMDADLAERLHQYADENDMTLTAAIERAVRQMLGVEKKKPQPEDGGDKNKQPDAE